MFINYHTRGAWAVGFLLICGLYFPTSIGEEISTGLLKIAFALLCGTLFLLILRPQGIGKQHLVVNSIFFLCILILFTITSPFTDITIGTIAGYSCLALLFTIQIKSVQLTTLLKNLFICANIINIAASILIIIGQEEVRSIFLNYYGFYFDDLLNRMINWYNKPVLTFASHSLASFFFFIFFYLNIRSYWSSINYLYLVLALCNLILLPFLTSFSALLFTLLGLLLLYMHYFKKNALASSLALLTILFTLYISYDYLGISVVEDIVREILSSDESGLMARYSSSSGLIYNTNIVYLMDHPFSPVGMTYTPSLTYGDSGPFEYLIRGSLFLLISIYGGLYYFLRTNMKSSKSAWLIFVVILLFELGIPTLTYFRFIYILPFVVVYLNGIEDMNRELNP